MGKWRRRSLIGYSFQEKLTTLRYSHYISDKAYTEWLALIKRAAPSPAISTQVQTESLATVQQ